MGYQINLEDQKWLQSSDGTALLAELASLPLNAASLLATITRLRKTYGRDQVAAAIETTQLRRRARSKFSLADQMFFDQEALEQSSSEPLARHRAKRLKQAAHLVELGCGIGGDSLALTEHSQVTAFERDLGRLSMAQANVAAYGHSERFTPCCADWTTINLPAADALYLDPSRRANGKRAFSIQRYQPPLTILHDLAHITGNVVTKVAPGVRDAELATLGFQGEIEIISLNGRCKEAVLWQGDLCTAKRRATLLPAGHTITDQDPVEPVALSSPRAFLYEPDNAVIRAHLVEQIATTYQMCKLHPAIAYLTADTLVQTPFAKAYAIEEIHPFNLKALRQRLQELNIGELIIKKRGFPMEPDALRKRLALQGDQTCILFLTMFQGKHQALICREARHVHD